METWRHGDMDMETTNGKRKRKPRWFSVYRFLIVLRNKRKLSVCKRAKPTKPTCPPMKISYDPLHILVTRQRNYQRLLLCQDIGILLFTIIDEHFKISEWMILDKLMILPWSADCVWRVPGVHPALPACSLYGHGWGVWPATGGNHGNICKQKYRYIYMYILHSCTSIECVVHKYTSYVHICIGKMYYWGRWL